MRVKWARRVVSMAAVVVLLCGIVACAQQDNRTIVTVWSWEPSMKTLATEFERENPDIDIVVKDTSGYENLNTAIQDGYGLPDVAQLEYSALPQYAVSGQLLDLTERTSDYSSFYSPGTWSSVTLNQRVYGVPMDSGPMAFFYNASVFDEAGVDATKIHTWDDYYQAAKRLKAIGAYIAADDGDASFYNAMIWLAGGSPFHTSRDGKTVTVNLTDDAGTRTFTDFWQKMIDEDLVDTHLTTWSDDWKRALGDGTVASLFTGAWMPSLLLSDVPGTAGLWRVSTMPTSDARPANAENGGSALSVLQSTRKPDAAFRFVEYVCHNEQGIATRVDRGAFPADNTTLNDPGFVSKTTIKDARGIDIPYFGGQRFNEVFAKASTTVSLGYQYLPFEVYARGDFRHTVGKAYTWTAHELAYTDAKSRKASGETNSDGSAIQVPDDPGERVSLMDGIELWQKDLKQYGFNQGFTIE